MKIGKWAQAGGKKQSSFKVPLFSLNHQSATSPIAGQVQNYQQMNMQDPNILQQHQLQLMNNQPIYSPTSSDVYLGTGPMDNQQLR